MYQYTLDPTSVE